MEQKSHDMDDIEILTIQLSDTLEEENDLTELLPKEQFASRPRKSIKHELMSYVWVIIIAFLAANLVTHFIIINAHVPTASMSPTIQVGDKLIGYRMAYFFSEPQRGDIIIFDHQIYDDQESETLVKRVIGLPGDTIFIQGGVLYINEKKYTEDYLAEPMVGNYGPVTVPANSVFVMGDNRNISDDARYWDNTFVSYDEIIAKAVLRYMPNWKIFQ